MRRRTKEQQRKLENRIVLSILFLLSIAVILLISLHTRGIIGNSVKHDNRFILSKAVNSSDECKTASANIVSQDRNWVVDSEQGVTIMYDLNYEEYSKEGKFISKLFDSSNDNGLMDYIYARYELDFNSRWNLAIWDIDSFGLSMLGQLGIKEYDYNDFSITYWRNKQDKRDEFIVYCKDKKKYNLDEEEVVRYIWTDRVYATYTMVPDWIVNKLVEKATSSDATKMEE